MTVRRSSQIHGLRKSELLKANIRDAMKSIPFVLHVLNMEVYAGN